MVLTPVQMNGQWFMNGLTQDQRDPFPMGRRIFRPGNGPHFVGFDDSFTEPIIVRAFYDPSQDPVMTNPYEFAGYIQFMQLNFKGTPIPPEVYGGMLADRTPYSDASPDYHFVDFMGPRDVNLRGFFEPFYAYNGSLLDGTLRQYSDFQRHPLPNGSLFYPQTTGPGLSLCASLSAEIATSLITESDIASWLTTDNLIYSIECSKQQLAQMEPYQIALNYLQSPPRELQGVGPADVAGQVVGQYVLISLPNYENMSPRLCISTRDQGEKVFVDIHLFGYADVESLEEETVMEALTRIYDFLEKRGIHYPGASNNAPDGRGQGGLLAAPFKLNPAEFCIELKYWTLVFAKRTHNLRRIPRFQLLNGFTWSALFQYDDDVRGLTLSSILEPELVHAYDWLKPYQAFRAALFNQNDSIDTSNFTKAAMRRDNLGTGVKLRFIDRSGTIIP
ncbi:MAG: hypothetical protein ACJ8BW_24750 [Ktedonobacteraceae bacterium]